MMRGSATGLRHEFIGLYGMVERNWYLIKRYAWWEIAFFFWTAANTLTIVFIAKGVVAEGRPAPEEIPDSGRFGSVHQVLSRALELAMLLRVQLAAPEDPDP